MLKIDSDLRMLGIEIQGLNKESIVQMTKMKNLSTELKRIEQQIETYHVTRTENLIKTKPEFSIKFDSSSAEIEIPHSTDMKINKTCQTDRQEPSLKINTLNMVDQSFIVQERPINQPQKNHHFQGNEHDSWTSNNDKTNTRVLHWAGFQN